MTVIFKVIILVCSIHLFFVLSIKAIPCGLNGELRRFKVCPSCVFEFTLRVCTINQDAKLEWTNVCFRDSWDRGIVDVYCRQNGYTGSRDGFTPVKSRDMHGNDEYKLNNIVCSGSENNLLECVYQDTLDSCFYPLYSPSSDCIGEGMICSVTNCSACADREFCDNNNCICPPGYTGECCDIQQTAISTTGIISTTGTISTAITTTDYVVSTDSTNPVSMSESSTPNVVTPIVSSPHTRNTTTNSNIPPNSQTKLVYTLLASLLGGSLIIIVLASIICFLCIFLIKNSKPRAKNVPVDYEIPNLTLANNTQFVAEGSFTISPISGSQTQFGRNITISSYEEPQMIISTEPIYDEIFFENREGFLDQSSSSYHCSMEENTLYSGFVEGEVGDSVLYEQFHQINCEKFDHIPVLEPIDFEHPDDNQYYVMQNRIYYVEPPSSLPQLENVFEHCFNEIKREEIEMGAEFASGQFGVVYRAVYHTEKGDIPVAIKTLKEAANSDTKVAFMREAAILAQFQHPNVLRMIGVLTTQQPYMMVTELLKTELAELLLKFKVVTNSNNTGSNHSAQKLNLHPLLLRFSQEISAGMKHLSEKHFIHRDLAARNVLVAKDMTCRIADFGMSRELNYESEYYTSSGGRIPLRWTAPEAVFFQKYSEKSDVWSFGMTLFEIWSFGEEPWGSGATNGEIIEAISTGRKLSPPTGCPRDVYSVMVDTWRMDPSSRPTFSHLLHQLTNIHLYAPYPLQCLSNDSSS
ncbi:hypothetical protein LOD99_3350 [Oopsacas minuta]|uniref:Receptor protein-tyrosine kinase n=1 Tax=Oopsacas minuta TaxID=111878 RepID=A0AAV7JY07_9METZ|nr:hypothetical protein LOD99_3350 [Oopsacas minuta]